MTYAPLSPANLQKCRDKHGDKYTYHSYSPKIQKIKYTCPVHGDKEQFLVAHLRGKGCFDCAVSSRLMTLDEFVVRAKKLHGDKYLYESVFPKGRQQAVIVCPEHGRFEQSCNAHLAGSGCSKCGNNAKGKHNKYSFENLKIKLAEVHGNKYQYLSLDVSEAKPKLKAVCPEHGEFIIGAYHHMTGCGCEKCGAIKIGDSKRYSLEVAVKKAYEKHGNKYTYLELESSRRSKLTIKCEKHGLFKQGLDKHLAGGTCPRCVSPTSKPTAEVGSYLESLGLEVQYEVPLQANPHMRFDLTLSQLDLAVEYHGEYWHSSKWKPANYHIYKHKLALQEGIRVLHLFGTEWDNKKEIVKNILAAACGVNKTKLYARKLKLCSVDSKEAFEFYDTYHIQGKPQSGQFVGLRQGEELVAVMAFSFNTSNRGVKATDKLAELTRYATKVNVIGGFTRLLKYWLKVNPSVEHVTSYSDVRLYSGKTYKLAGFEEAYTTKPNYKYLESGDVLRHKSNYQKSKLVQRFGAEACAGKTERQITEEQGLYRVYDCGLTKWVLNVKR